MDREVKPRRPYEGAARQARTRRTRAAVVEAARSLFVERGYAATTIEAKLADVTAAGATVKEPVRDVGGVRLVATVTDPDGNVLGLLQDR